MEPYIIAAANAGQTLATQSADYIAREKRRKIALSLALVAVALLVAIAIRKR